MIRNFAGPLRKTMRKDDGVDGDAQRISQIVWLLFLKILDGLEEEKELIDPAYKTIFKKKYRWKNWAANPEGMTGEELITFVNDDLFPYLKNIKPNNGEKKLAQIVKEIFDDAINFMKSGTLLKQVINQLNQIDFKKTSDRNYLGDFYEQMLKELQSAGKAGEFYTPRAITNFMTEIINPSIDNKMIDPACGTGGFITSYLTLLRKKKIKTISDEKKMLKNFYGIDKKNLPFTLCVTNMLLHNVIPPDQIVRKNLLKKPYIDYSEKDMVDVVLTNPPFGGEEEDGIEMNFPQDFRTRETADLFLFVTLRILNKKKSKCAIILPDNFLFTKEGVKRRLKEKLLSEFNVHTIVKLHSSTFKPYAEVKTNIVFFNKKKNKTEEIWYFEHPLPKGYKAYSKTKTIQDYEFELEKKWWNNRKKNENAWLVTIKDIKDNNFDMDFKNPNLKILKDKENPLKKLERFKSNFDKIQKSINELSGILKK